MGFDCLHSEELAIALLELAQKSGAEAAEVLQSRSHSSPVFFEANRLKELQSSESEGTALRVWRDGRPGIAVAYGPVNPQLLVDRALSLSELNQPETISLTEGKPIIYADEGQAVPVEQLLRWGEEAIDRVREAHPEVLCTVDCDCEVESTLLINSLGLDVRHQDTTVHLAMSVDWVRGDDFLAVSDGLSSRGDLNPQAIANQIIQRLDWAQENVDPCTGRVPILFTSKAADMLWGTLHAALNGKRVLEGSSPWSEYQGSQVTHEAITTFQAPDIGPFSCPFDDEGTPTQHLVFIQNGVLQNFYCDRTTGRLLGKETTGNGFRPGLGSYPTPGLFNWLVQPAESSFIDLVAELDDGIIVDQILGGGAGISGDFSVNVDLGYRVKKGQIIGRVKDTMVAGNVYTALKQLIKLGADAEWNGSCYTPSLIVGGLSVTGRLA